MMRLSKLSSYCSKPMRRHSIAKTPKSRAKDRVASVWFGCGLGVEWFEWFRFSVLAVLWGGGVFCVSVQLNREARFRFRFRFPKKKVLAVPGPR